MDIRAPGWFGQLQLSGIAKPINFGPGTILGINAEILKQLQQLSPRSLTGGKNVTVLFAQTPFTDSKASQEAENKFLEVATGLDDSEEESGPQKDETYEMYVIRLMDSGLAYAQATFIANDWFDKPQDQKLEKWLTDPRAIQFRKLNSNQQAFENAMPGEYATLKTYVTREYPEQCKAIVFKVA